MFKDGSQFTINHTEVELMTSNCLSTDYRAEDVVVEVDVFCLLFRRIVFCNTG